MRKPRYYYESNFYHVMVQGDEKKYVIMNMIMITLDKCI